MTTQPFEQTLIVEPPDISLINIEDDEPVDNIISAKQQRLLVESLYASWHPNVKFIADANVGIFASPYRPAIVPDVFISMDATLPADMQQKRNRTYFIWEYGKSPEVA
ncbi:MAG TPA: Uma2 family endonuclease, partial [Anaerolineae bacterium]|nr:Uma2 family endonuclease [Anaerolineae bacterium]